MRCCFLLVLVLPDVAFSVNYSTTNCELSATNCKAINSPLSLIQTLTRTARDTSRMPPNVGRNSQTSVDEWWAVALNQLSYDAGEAPDACVPSGFGDSYRYHGGSPVTIQDELRLQHNSLASKVSLAEWPSQPVQRLKIFESNLAELLQKKSLMMAIPVDYDFDTDRLAGAVTSMLVKHGYGTTQYSLATKSHAQWTTISLTSKNGSYYDEGCHRCIPTELWNSTRGYVHELFEPIISALMRIRLSNLFPRELITYHVDYVPRSRVCRCHVPVTGTDRATTRIGMQKAPSKPGEMYCGDFVFPHTVWNEEGGGVRTHIMLDVNLKKSKILRRTELGQAMVEACTQMFAQAGRKHIATAAQHYLHKYTYHSEKPSLVMQRAAAEKIYFMSS